MLILKRPFIWVRRFFHRCGYGVHSPFAFDFITTVIYEKSPYYAYKELEPGKQNEKNAGKGKSPKINRLLFRLVNRAQPVTIVEIGKCVSTSSYLRAGKKGASYIHFETPADIALPEDAPIGFLYIHHFKKSGEAEKAFDACIQHALPHSVFVLEGIGYSREMKRLWRKMTGDDRVGITFDLYDLGILFFDKKKIKQHYTVNF